ncbi:MAG: hypothetical protein WCO60_09515 [Verrucomicrobiota bacterium]
MRLYPSLVEQTSDITSHTRSLNLPGMQLCRAFSLPLAAAALSACVSASALPAATIAAEPKRVAIDLDPALEAKAWDWLVQKVVVDKQGHVLRCDPYNAPAGTSLRSLQAGEALPYYRRDYYKGTPQGMQRRDAYPVRDPSGQLWVVNPFDYKPHLEFNLFCDGYDAYQVREGWVSAPHTLDGGGFSTTFFGEGGKPYNGWTFFPTAIFKQNPPASGTAPCVISGVYWEHNGHDFPGKPPAKQAPYETRWEFIPQFLFSGIDPNPARRKRIDTIRAVHGHFNGYGIPVTGHVEATYFTQLYGSTRWEVWVPKNQLDDDEQLRKAAARVRAESCDCEDEIQYLGVPYVVTACRDWSEIEIPATPLAIPAWPFAPMNLLKNFHFSRSLSNWQTAPGLQSTITKSTAPLDARFVQTNLGGTGVQALEIRAEKTASEPVVWQDVAMGAAITTGEYTWGLNARVANGKGSISISLEQLDSKANRLSKESFTQTVSASNARYSGNESIRLSSQYLSNHANIRVDHRTRFLRFGIQPAAPGDYQILEAWLMKQSY